MVGGIFLSFSDEFWFLLLDELAPRLFAWDEDDCPVIAAKLRGIRSKRASTTSRMISVARNASVDVLTVTRAPKRLNRASTLSRWLDWKKDVSSTPMKFAPSK